MTCYTEGFSHFVTSMTAPVASGWSVRRVGLAPTGKRRLLTAHANCGHSQTAWRSGQIDPLQTVRTNYNVHRLSRDVTQLLLRVSGARRFRSVPFGTPPSLAFSLLHQGARRDFVGGPARVLKHTQNGSKGFAFGMIMVECVPLVANGGAAPEGMM